MEYKKLIILILFIHFSVYLLSGCSQFPIQRHSQSGYSSKVQSYVNDYERSKLMADSEGLIDSRRERELYSQALQWFQSDDERREFLALSGFKAKREWLQEKGIFQRGKVVDEEEQQTIDSQDIYLGMPQEFVKRSWGDPDHVEVSGNPSYKNERWKYSRTIASENGFNLQNRYIYFESGRVIGWETK